MDEFKHIFSFVDTGPRLSEVCEIKLYFINNFSGNGFYTEFYDIVKNLEIDIARGMIERSANQLFKTLK